MARRPPRTRPESRRRLLPLTKKAGLRLLEPAPLLSSAQLRSIVTRLSPSPSPPNISAPFVLSAKHTYEDQATGAFLASSGLNEFNAGYPFIGFPYAAANTNQPAGRLTVNLLNKPQTGYALQYRVFNDGFGPQPGKYRIDVYTEDYFTPSQQYELNMQPEHQTFGFYLPPSNAALVWMSLVLYPVWALGAGKWTLYDITINMTTF